MPPTKSEESFRDTVHAIAERAAVFATERRKLEAEEQMRYKSHSESVKPELGDENEIHEICVGAISGKAEYQGSICRAELRGEEHSKELE